MPAIETQSLNQKAVLWEAVGVDDYGVVTLDSPVEIDVRWQTKDIEVIDHIGRSVITEVTVVVDREIAMGSILWKGELADIGVADLSDLRKVVERTETPDIKAREFKRTVRLAKFNSTLPELA